MPSPNKLKKIFSCFVLVILFLPQSLLAYSEKYCISLLNAQADAINADDFKMLLSVATDRVKNCGQFITADELSNSIENLALARRELGDPRSALKETEHCLRVADNPGCRLERGLALLELSRRTEAVDELKHAKRVAGLMQSRSRSKLNRTETQLDRMELHSRISYYQSIMDASDRILAELGPELSPKRQAELHSTKYTGSGILLNLDGYVLTNKHVVENCKSITATNSAGEKSSALLTRSDETLDLAILASQLRPSRSAIFRSEPAVQIGERVSAIGYPLAGILAKGVNVSFGHIGALAGVGNDPTKIQVSAPVQPGNSGGPILDHGGLVVGIVVQKLNASQVEKLTGDIPQNINFAVNGGMAQLFLKSSRVNFTAIPSGATLEETEVAARGSLVTVFVECER